MSRAPAALVVPRDRAFFETTVCGTSLLVRTICALGRTADEVYVWRAPECTEADVRRVEEEVGARDLRPRLIWVPSAERLPRQRDLLVAFSPAVFDPRVGAHLRDVGREKRVPVRCRRSADETAVLWFVPQGAMTGRLQNIDRFEATLREGKEILDLSPEALCMPITDEASRQEAERRLIAGARKDSDAFIAKHFDRRISSWLTRRVVDLPITPNQLTVANTGLGLIGVALLLAGTYGYQLAGASLLLLSIILDGCDGEIARIKLMESSFGRKLDFFLDNVVNSLSIFACGAGYALQHGDRLLLAASVFSGLLAIATVLPVYVLFFRSPGSTTGGSGTESITESLAGRDFVYLIFFLALFGRAHWFTVLAAVGLPIFFTVVLVLFLHRRKS